MEFKLDATAEKTLQQIRDKDYPLQFTLDTKPTFLIGANFSSTIRTIDNYLIENQNCSA
jgi:hypothetical protein